MNSLPEPFTNIDHDVEGFDGFLLNVEKLFASELWALSSGDEYKAATGLWGRAWKQRPAGSLPDDDKTLQAFSGAGSKWRKVKEMALRGFVKCSDGRLYHTTLCEDVRRAAESKRKNTERTAAATEARKTKTEKQRNEKRDVDRDVDRDDIPISNVTTSHRIERNRIEIKEEDQKEEGAPQKRGAPLPDDFQADQTCSKLADDLGMSNEERRNSLDKFRDYWRAVPGAKGRKSDWQATFRNWIRKDCEIKGGNHERHRKPQRKGSNELLLEGVYGKDLHGDG